MLVSMPINGSASSIKRTPGNSREDRAWEGCNGGAEGKRRTCPRGHQVTVLFRRAVRQRLEIRIQSDGIWRSRGLNSLPQIENWTNSAVMSYPQSTAATHTVAFRPKFQVTGDTGL
jgi:hypothetical protein